MGSGHWNLNHKVKFINVLQAPPMNNFTHACSSPVLWIYLLFWWGELAIKGWVFSRQLMEVFLSNAARGPTLQWWRWHSSLLMTCYLQEEMQRSIPLLTVLAMHSSHRVSETAIWNIWRHRAANVATTSMQQMPCFVKLTYLVLTSNTKAKDLCGGLVWRQIIGTQTRFQKSA